METSARKHNRKHLGSDNEIQNFQTFGILKKENETKKNNFGRSKTIRKQQQQKKCETRNILYHFFLGKRRTSKTNLGMTISGLKKMKFNIGIAFGENEFGRI